MSGVKAVQWWVNALELPFIEDLAIKNFQLILRAVNEAPSIANVINAIIMAAMEIDRGCVATLTMQVPIARTAGQLVEQMCLEGVTKGLTSEEAALLILRRVFNRDKSLSDVMAAARELVVASQITTIAVYVYAKMDANPELANIK